ncbi:MAG: hypothetical protein J5881_04730 [Clostridia bacterium]|nr:hypothetical protein [Clostridia bacterium]
MNQILSTENVNNKYKGSKKSGGPKDIKSVTKFFASGLLIFGVFLIINSSYAMLKKDGGKTPKDVGEPTIELEEKGEDKILLKVMHEEDVDSLVYAWNEEDPTTVRSVGKFYQKELDIPNGVNTLNVKATDIYGNEKEMERTFELSLSTNIDISISGNSIKINLEGKEEITKFTYAWDEEEPKKVDVNNTEYSMEIEAPLGRHTLKVTATNINDEVEEKTQEVVGTKQPTVTVKKGDNAYAISAHDEIGLDRIEITTLKDGKVTKIQADGQDLDYNFPLKLSDDNLIEIVAYNENGVKSKKLRAKWPKK